MKRALSLIILTSALFSLNASAFPLSNYRTQLRTLPQSEFAALNRAESLRVALGTSKHRIPGLSLIDHLAKSRGSNSTKRSSSLLIKTILGKGADAMYRQEMHGKPAVFDPSLFENERSHFRDVRRINSCLVNLRGDFKTLLNAYADYITNKKENKKAASNEVDDLLIQELNTETSGYASTLGRLVKVSYADDVVQKLDFLPPMTGNKAVDFAPWMPIERKISISLSMLTTYRTGKDEYFLATLGCFVDSLAAANKKEEDRSAFENRLAAIWTGTSPGLVDMVLHTAKEDLKGAVFSHTVLSKLGAEKINELIDLFLQLRGVDVPVALDFSSTTRSLITVKLGISPDDFQFYKLMNDQLFELENFFREEKAQSVQTKKIVKEIQMKGRR